MYTEIKLCFVFSILEYFYIRRRSEKLIFIVEMARLNLCFILVMSLVYCTLAEEKYTNKYDNFNIDQVLNNDRILTNYVKCLMEEGSCTNEGRELKSKYHNGNCNYIVNINI